MIVVDTNVWSEATKPEPNGRVRAWATENRASLWLSTIVLAELRAGIALLPQGRRRLQLGSHIDAIVRIYSDRILDFDEAASRSYADVLENARNAGKPMSMADAMIAATAKARGMKVATRDLDGFAGAGIDLIDPWLA